jgi:CBS domain-containing protein
MAQSKTVAEIMTTKVVTLYEEDNLETLSEGLEHFHFRHLPVIDDGRLVGIISQRDLLQATVAGMDRSPMALAREARFLEETFVRDVMTTDVITARAEEPVRDAAKRMVEAKIGALPVVDDEGLLLGIVTENDIVRVALSAL